MPRVFSGETLGKFEDASASVPLRRLDRAFEAVGIRPGADPGGLGGDRRTQFRRYIAGVDQRDPEQLRRLGAALGSLIAAVATSKEAYLVDAAERDGFVFASGAFTPAPLAARSAAETPGADIAAVDQVGGKLRLLVRDSPSDAVAGALELVESICASVAQRSGDAAPAKDADLVATARAALEALPVDTSGSAAAEDATLVWACLNHLVAVGARLGHRRTLSRSTHGDDGEPRDPTPREARLAVDAAVTFAAFFAGAHAIARA